MKHFWFLRELTAKLGQHNKLQIVAKGKDWKTKTEKNHDCQVRRFS